MTYLILILSFLCGSIPFGYLLVKKYKHQDIREVGSGNIGSTNVRRAAGKKISILTQLLDMAKGMVPVFITCLIFDYIDTIYTKQTLCLASAFGAILGHDFSPFLKFKGGKGVNTTLGAFFLLAPIPVILTGFSFKLLKLLTPIVSVRSLIICLLLPIFSFLLKFDLTVIYAQLAAAAIIFLRHIDNIKRLYHHTEN